MPESIGINLRVTGHCSQGGRKYMEDFFSICYQQSEDERDLEYAFFGIYDGHGGSEAATFAKDHLMNSIISQKLFWSDSDQDILRAIREGYIATHYAMWREQEKWPKTATGLPSTAGTTASVAFIRRGKMYIGHVGDSGIVLGYQEEGDKFWRARPLTHDHKPECTVEKNRIIKSGGKVVSKSGVARVVWNRPRIGHKGPVRRSTPFDEIPFLAVARSLGDLWSYNSTLNQFVVSPDPDVKVVRIDPKTFRCLIFGTDGLWNVVSPVDAVEVARDTEMINNKNVVAGSSEWTSPSKCLVEKALQRWSMKRMRADNTTVVTVMLDPPGPPKKEMLKGYCRLEYAAEDCNSSSYGIMQQNNVIRTAERNRCISPYIDVGDNESFVSLLEHLITDDKTGSKSEMVGSISPATSAINYNNSLSIPANGYAIMTRYENNCDNNISFYGNHSSDTMNTCDLNESTNNSASNITNDVDYMNSFAESYNSLLVPSFDHNDMLIDDDHGRSTIQHPNEHEQEHQQHQQQQYQQQCMSTEEGYSLTKLETRGEQQLNSIRNYASNSHNIIPTYDSFIDDHNYQYDSITSTYQQTILSDHLSDNYRNLQLLRHNIIQMPREIGMELYEEPEFENNCRSSTPEKPPIILNNLTNQPNTSLDSSEVQINEISSSGTCLLVDDGDDDDEEIEEDEDDAEVEDDIDVEIEDDEVEEGGEFDDSLDRTASEYSVKIDGNTDDNDEKITLVSADDTSTFVIKSIECDNPPPKRVLVQEKVGSSSRFSTRVNKPKILNGQTNNNKLNALNAKKIYSIEQNENISSVERRRLRSSAIFANNAITHRTLRSKNSLTKYNTNASNNNNNNNNNNNKQNIKPPIILNHQLSKLRSPCLRPRQNDQNVHVWQPRPKRIKLMENSGNSRTVSSTSTSTVKPPVNILNGKTLTSSLSQITSTLAASCTKPASNCGNNTRITRKNTNSNSNSSSWCIQKRPAIRTRYRAQQKRLNPY